MYIKPQFHVQMSKAKMKYRVGKKQARAILDENGLEVALFREGSEDLAKACCTHLNTDLSGKEEEVLLAYNGYNEKLKGKVVRTSERTVIYIDDVPAWVKDWLTP